MKKLLVSLIAVSMVLSIPGSAFAAFTPDSAIEKTAQATVTGIAGVPIVLSVLVKNISGSAATDVAWTGITAGSADWKNADQYLEVGGFATYPNWGIQVYTDNKNAVDLASGKYTGLGDPAGLVSTSTGQSTIPLCWRIAVKSGIRDGRFTAGSDDLKMQEKYIATGTAAGKTVILRVPGDYTSDTDFFAPWAWMLDKGADLDPDLPGVQPYSNYTSLVVSGNVHIAAGENALNYVPIPERTAKYCIYLGAKFTAAAASVIYKTTKLTVEMYHL